MIISPDAMLYNGRGEYEWSEQRVKAAWEGAWHLYKTYVDSGQIEDVVVLCGIPGSGKSTLASTINRPGRLVFDATFINRRRRKDVFLATPENIPVKGVWIRVIHSVARKRNQERGEDRRVPDSTIDRMISSFEPPLTDEGFSSVYYVNGDGNAIEFPGGRQIHSSLI
jgi:predicted kinase